jgi:hypothetical protein
MRQEKGFLLCMVVVATASPALAAGARYPINTQQVAAAVSRTGMEIAPEQVTLLSDVVSSTSAPHLSVRSMQRWGNQKMMARLECESSDQCLPFFVSLNVSSEAQGSSGAQPSLPPAFSPTPRHVVVKSGTPATLMLDGPRVHIRLSVICMENGATGQTIRVSDRDRKVFFRAQVVDSGLLQGRL